MIEHVTFLLAFAGFVILAFDAALAAKRRRLRWLSAIMAAVAVIHVAMVWSYRYEFSFAQATRNGYVGFLVFHSALAALITAVVAPPRIARWLTLFAFFAVCVGANGAVFRYEVVRWYRVPVIVCTAAAATRVWLEMRKSARP